jgi:predicted amidohydrolase YtcJ
VNDNLMLLNGKIYTMDPELPPAEAVAIRDQKIIAVGKNTDVENLGKVNFQVINLEGKTVIPGLIDGHTHFLSYAYRLRKANLEGISSLEAIRSVLDDFCKKLKPGEWVVGDGWDKNLLKEESVFTKEKLDEICPQNPVALQSKDHHLLWVNSTALQLAGVGKYTNDPPGGRIEKDPETNELTGILKENAVGLVWDKVPSLSASVCRELFGKALKIANSYGLTGIHDFEDQDAFHLFQEFWLDKSLTLRACCWIPDGDLDSAISLGLGSSFGNEYLRIGGVKLYCDGTLGSQTALMFEPYEGSSDNFGIEVTSLEELKEIVQKASHAGISVSIHAIGDKGVHNALNAIEYSLSNAEGKNRLRHRVEHIQLLHPEDVERFRKLDIIASVQPVHAPSDRQVAEKYWGSRCNRAYPYKTILSTGARIAFGSDAPIESLNPLKGIYAAVRRKKVGEKESWNSVESLSVAEAVHAFTLGASFASCEEKIKGSIQAGKLGDVVILSQDIFDIDPELIPDTKVEYTILGGKIVYQR